MEHKFWNKPQADSDIAIKFQITNQELCKLSEKFSFYSLKIKDNYIR